MKQPTSPADAGNALNPHATERSRRAWLRMMGGAGLGGADGATHAGSFDVTYLSTLPNFVVMAAASSEAMNSAAVQYFCRAW